MVRPNPTVYEARDEESLTTDGRLLFLAQLTDSNRGLVGRPGLRKTTETLVDGRGG